MVALHKLGAVAIPATNQLKDHDFEYRYNAAGVKALVCTADGDTAEIAERAAKNCDGKSIRRERAFNHSFAKERKMAACTPRYDNSS
jgi:acetyl-CoA synthetase